MVGSVPLYEETPDSLLSLLISGGHSKKAHLQARKRALFGNYICQYLDFGLPRLQNYEK